MVPNNPRREEMGGKWSSILHDMVAKFQEARVAPWQNQGGHWVGVGSPWRSRLTLGLERREMKSKSTGVSSRGASPPPPSHSHHIPRRRDWVLAPPPRDCSSFRRTDSFLGGPFGSFPEMSVALAVTPWLGGFCGLDERSF
jgi:hypothetical protein